MTDHFTATNRRNKLCCRQISLGEQVATCFLLDTNQHGLAENPVMFTDVPPSNSPSTSTDILTIEGITEPSVLHYFKTLNSADFQATAALFAINGQLNPPFESPLEGPDAITAYLEAEAQGMQLYPRQGVSEIEGDLTQVQVAGKAQTSFFVVNVSWIFVLNRENKILNATIKLLASPQELLNLRR